MRLHFASDAAVHPRDALSGKSPPCPLACRPDPRRDDERRPLLPNHPLLDDDSGLPPHSIARMWRSDREQDGQPTGVAESRGGTMIDRIQDGARSPHPLPEDLPHDHAAQAKVRCAAMIGVTAHPPSGESVRRARLEIQRGRPDNRPSTGRPGSRSRRYAQGVSGRSAP